MMPYIQGDPDSVPDVYSTYYGIIASTYLEPGKIGFLTIDESPVNAGKPHRGDRAKFGRALHTEAGWRPFTGQYAWGGGGWGTSPAVTLDRDVEILLANSIAGSCAYWPTEHPNTSADGDIGDCAESYPYDEAVLMGANEVHRIGILTPHESMPIAADGHRQFLRIMGEGVHGREPYFTTNPLVN
jgi:hypothetical protein